MNKRDVMSHGDRMLSLIFGLAVMILGSVVAIMEASTYFWGQRVAHHTTHGIAALWASAGVAMAALGAAVVVGVINGTSIKNDNRKGG